MSNVRSRASTAPDAELLDSGHSATASGRTVRLVAVVAACALSLSGLLWFLLTADEEQPVPPGMVALATGTLHGHPWTFLASPIPQSGSELPVGFRGPYGTALPECSVNVEFTGTVDCNAGYDDHDYALVVMNLPKAVTTATLFDSECSPVPMRVVETTSRFPMNFGVAVRSGDAVAVSGYRFRTENGATIIAGRCK